MIDDNIEELEDYTIENNNNENSENNNETSENNELITNKEIEEFSNMLINKFPIENNSERSYFYFQIKEIDSVKINNCYIYSYNSSLEKNKYYYRLVIDLDKNINLVLYDLQVSSLLNS